MNKENIKVICATIVLCVFFISLFGAIAVMGVHVIVTNDIKMDNNTLASVGALTSMVNKMMEKNITMDSVILETNGNRTSKTNISMTFR